MSNLKNVKLATATNITTTYAGEFAGEYIAAALLSASTIDDGGLTVKANIAFKEVIKKLATGALVQAAACDFTPNSSVTLTERIIQPVELMVNLQLCKYDFVNDWESQSMGFGLGQTLPAANIVEKLSDVVTAIPAQLYGKEDLFIYIGSKAAKLYVQALGGFAANGLGANGVSNMGTQWWNNGSLTVNGVKIFVGQGLSDDKMYAAQRSNLYFGTGLLNSTQEVKVLDMSDLDASNNARIVMRFTSTVQFGIASDIVSYT